MEKDVCKNRHGGVDTSRDAFKSLSSLDRERLRDMILAQVQFSQGLTCDELENMLGLTHQTASARVTELLAAKKIHFTEARRKTRSGRSARIYYFGWIDQAPQMELFK